MEATKNATDVLKAKLHKQDAHTPTEEVLWQQYRSARAATRTITDKGKHIKFTHHEYYTRESDVVEWLDKEIAGGTLPGITRGELVTTSERDPLEKLKKKHIAEYIKEQEEAALAVLRGESPDMGNSKSPGAASINPASSKLVANGASGAKLPSNK